MKSGIKFERGETTHVPFPFTDMSKSKLRPVLVISNTSHNKKSSDFVCCGITSNLNNKNDSIMIKDADMIEGALAKKSRTKFSSIFTLQKNSAVRKIGQLGSKKLGVATNSIKDMIS